MDNFADEFHTHFEIVAATTPELVRECQRLRYRVFCKEHHIFCANRYHGDEECDSYDNQSAHSLMRHRNSGIAVATVRLVFPNKNVDSFIYPLEAHLGNELRPTIMQYCNNVSKLTLAEISRFAVSKDFRRRFGERRRVNNLVLDLNTEISERGIRHHPYITLGLFKAIVQMSAICGIHHWCAAMEPTLIRLLTRFGIEFVPIGPLIEFFGLRQPCISSVKSVLEGIHVKRPDIWDFITDAGREYEHWAS